MTRDVVQGVLYDVGLIGGGFAKVGGVGSRQLHKGIARRLAERDAARHGRR